jgi:hypothetical protein
MLLQTRLLVTVGKASHKSSLWGSILKFHLVKDSSEAGEAILSIGFTLARVHRFLMTPLLLAKTGNNKHKVSYTSLGLQHFSWTVKKLSLC